MNCGPGSWRTRTNSSLRCWTERINLSRCEFLRARVEDIDFDAKLVLLREKKRNRDRETFRTVDMTPFLESVMRKYFADDHPGGVYAFCSKPNEMLTDGQTWKA